MSNLTDCRTCGHKVATDAKSCPNCGCPKPTTEQYNRRFMHGEEKHWSSIEKILMNIAAIVLILLTLTGAMDSCAR